MSGHYCRGFSLTELLIVVVILGIVAVVVVPEFSASNEKQLDKVANEITQAIRFARSEAIRTGVPHGVMADESSQRVRVYWLDTTGASPTPTYSVYHPVDKKLYDLHLQTEAYPAHLSSIYLKFSDTAPINFLSFAATTGTPQYNDLSTIRMLESAIIKVSYGDEERSVSVAPITGRATVQ